MKQRLPYIATALLGLILLVMHVPDMVTGQHMDVFGIGFGVYCLLFGGYKSVHPNEKE